MPDESDGGTRGHGMATGGGVRVYPEDRAQAKNLADVYDVVKRCTFPGKNYVVGPMGDAFYVQIEYMEADVRTGDMERQGGRKFYVSTWATESEIVQTCLKAALASAEHQVREHFRYQRTMDETPRAIYGPHFSANALYAMATDKNTDARPPHVETG